MLTRSLLGGHSRADSEDSESFKLEARAAGGSRTALEYSRKYRKLDVCNLLYTCRFGGATT